MSSPEQVDLVYALIKLSDALKRFAAEAMSDQLDSDKWFRLATVLAEAARQCRQQVPVDEDSSAAWSRWVRATLGNGVTRE